MGSSAKKRRDKKKDFQVYPKLFCFGTVLNSSTEAKAKSWESPTKACKFHRYQFQIKVHCPKSAIHRYCRALCDQPVLASSIAVNISHRQPAQGLIELSDDCDLYTAYECSTTATCVRTQLLKLLRALAPNDVEDHVEQVLLYIRAGITHLAADIRSSTMDMLMWALECCGNALVSCPGGWVKTLKSLMAMQGWPVESSSAAWSSGKTSFGKPGSEGKTMVRSLNIMASLVRAGLEDSTHGEKLEAPVHGFPLTDVGLHLVSKRSNCFSHLDLFGPPRDEETQIYEDREARQRVFQKRFRGSIERGVEAAKQEGGEVGRAATSVQKAVNESMKDFEGAE
ncbi:MAG: hypothetical protein Q9225_007073 [Loekoesia sp. 1 TL-2023]